MIQHDSMVRENAIDHLTNNYKLGENMLKLCKVILSHVQDLEDMWFSMTFDRQLASAYGDCLDQIGKLVGEARGALRDADYKRFIHARIAINTCDGQKEQLIAILAAMTGAERVYIHDSLPGCIRAHYWVRVPLSAAIRSRIVTNMNDAAPAGVRVILIEALFDNWLGFAADSRASGLGVGRLGTYIS